MVGCPSVGGGLFNHLGTHKGSGVSKII
jgi:hypothetical protein